MSQNDLQQWKEMEVRVKILEHAIKIMDQEMVKLLHRIQSLETGVIKRA